VQNNEPSFCDGYTNAVSNRTVFPLSSGVITLNSEHPQWTVGVLVSTKPNPSSFSDFNNASGGNQVVVNFFQTSGAGLACFNMDLSRSGVSGVVNGANVSIEVVFDGGDGQLYQCADLTLSNSIVAPSNATSSCTNITSAESNVTATSTTSASPMKTGGGVGDIMKVPGVGMVLLALVAAAFVL